MSETWPLLTAVGSLLLWLPLWLAGVAALPPAARADDAASGTQNATAEGSPGDPSLGEIATLPLEKLMDVEVVTVAKHGEKLSDTPAATFVLTAEDIRRSGATSIPEVLRLVPGLDVAQVNSSTWAVSARGFNGLFANKLLVLIDGRSVYTPFYSGVFWIDEDLMLEDIERIEVVRGPGGTLWGANAMNGIINIITKSAKDTQGTLASVGGGTEDHIVTSVRHGGEIEDLGAYRIYSKYQQHDGSQYAGGGAADDSWQRFRSGGRFDGTIAPGTSLTMLGDWGFSGEHLALYEPVRGDDLSEEDNLGPHTTSGDLLGRVESKLSENSTVQAQVSYERVNKHEIVPLREDILDVDLQHSYRFDDSNQLTYGAGYRHAYTDTDSTDFLRFDPTARSRDTFSWFLSDEIALVPKKLVLSLGSKFEHNELTSFEFQPSIRLRYSPNDHHTFWTAVTRAVRTPSVADEDVSLDIDATRDPKTGAAVVPVLLGDGDVRSDTLVAYEAGYRTSIIPKSAVDISIFFNSYNNLSSRLPGTPVSTTGVDGTPVVLIPLDPGNDGNASYWGGEIVDTTRVTGAWKISGWYSYLRFDRDQDTSDNSASPENQFGIRSSYDFAPGWEGDVFLRYSQQLTDLHVASVTDLTARIAWKLDSHLTLAVVGQHLLEDHHEEFVSDFLHIRPSEIQRGIFANATYTF